MCLYPLCTHFQNAFPVSGLFSTHLLSLDALLAVIDSIEQHCHHRILTTATEASKNTTQTEGKMMHRVNMNSVLSVKIHRSVKVRDISSNSYGSCISTN